MFNCCPCWRSVGLQQQQRQARRQELPAPPPPPSQAQITAPRAASTLSAAAPSFAVSLLLLFLVLILLHLLLFPLLLVQWTLVTYASALASTFSECHYIHQRPRHGYSDCHEQRVGKVIRFCLLSYSRRILAVQMPVSGFANGLKCEAGATESCVLRADLHM